MDVVEIDAATGEVTVRGFNNAEKMQRAQDKKDQEAAETRATAQALADAAASDAAYAHAKKLGFTDDMLRTIFPNYPIPKSEKDATL